MFVNPFKFAYLHFYPVSHPSPSNLVLRICLFFFFKQMKGILRYTSSFCVFFSLYFFFGFHRIYWVCEWISNTFGNFLNHHLFIAFATISPFFLSRPPIIHILGLFPLVSNFLFFHSLLAVCIKLVIEGINVLSHSLVLYCAIVIFY